LQKKVALIKFKILIVEDESIVAFEIASALKKENYIITAIVDCPVSPRYGCLI
jgi:CheY-like chemotaxis protein